MDYNTDYKEFYNTFPSSYFCSLPDGTIIDSNKNFLELTNYSREEVIGQKKITDFLSLGEKIYFESVFIPALKLSGTIAEVNFNFIKKGGTKSSRSAKKVTTALTASVAKSGTGLVMRKWLH